MIKKNTPKELISIKNDAAKKSTALTIKNKTTSSELKILKKKNRRGI